MTGIRRSLVLSTSERYFIIAANLATLAIVSRLLTPAEIGVSVLGLAISMLVLTVREFATPIFLIQRKELQLQEVRTTVTILMIVSAAISLLIMVSAGGLAVFYEEPGLAPFLRVLSLWMLVQIIGAPITALLRREMAFGKVAAINITGAAVCTGLTIAFAMNGFSYMSFAWALLASEVAIASMCLFVWKDRSIFKPSLCAWRCMVTFGGYNGTNVLLYKIYESLPYLALGRTLPTEALALYNRAFQICLLPEKMILGGAMNVLLSAFSAEVRNGGGLRDPYLHSIEIITAILWPALVLIAILAEPIVHIVLGDQWLGAVPLVRIMAIASLFSFSAELNYPVLIALGAMRDLLWRSLIAWPISAVVITCAAFIGLKAAALSWLITVPFQAYISIYFVRRHVDVAWRDIIFSLRKGAALALFSAIGPLSVVVYMDRPLDLSIGATIGIVALGLIGWGAGLRLTMHPLWSEIERVVGKVVGSLLSASKRAQILRR